MVWELSFMEGKMKVFDSSFILVIMLCAVLLSGCSEKEEKSEETQTASVENVEVVSDEQEVATPEEKINPQIEVTVEKQDPIEAIVDDNPELLADGDDSGDNPDAGDGETDDGSSLTNPGDSAPEDAIEGGEHDHIEEEQPKQAPRIIWLGDSLTQGSLGDRDDNLANAPYVRLAGLLSGYGNVVEGYGYYGYNTHDILWKYGETLNGAGKDADAIYIFWCGSNDWVDDHVANTETGGVISEIDNFLANNGNPISKYIVIGTTARYQLREGALYEVINASLSGHYGAHYMDVNSFISQDVENGGYVIDQVHLTQESYDKVADAVFSKLKALGYI